MPLTTVTILPSGRAARLQMPNLYGILATVGRVPSQLMIDVLNLLVADGAYTPEQADGDKYIRKRETIRGMYAIASLCMVEPRLRLDGTPETGEISPDDLSWRDVEAVYHGYFRGIDQFAAFDGADAACAGWPASAPPDGDAVPQEAE